MIKKGSVMRGVVILMLMHLCISGQHIYSQKRESLPNVIFILADDIGYGDLGCYGGKIATPNLDKLAAEGIRFTDAHAPAALCAPSRFSMLTGSYPYRSSQAGGAWNISSPSVFNDPHRHTKAGRKITIAEVLQSEGYRTAFLGKSHLGGDVRDIEGRLIRKKDEISKMDFSKGVSNSINEIGFDYSYFLPSGIQHEPFAFFENGLYAPFNPNKPATNESTKLWKNGKYKMTNGISQIVEHAKNTGVGDEDYNSSQTGIMITNKAISFIDTHLQQNKNQGEEKPFLIYFASQAIHVPHTPPNDFDGDDTEINEKVKGVTGGATSDMIYELDIQVGKLLQKLEDEGIADNTIIFFTSDNGALKPKYCKYGNSEHDNNGPLRGYKSEIYEGGHRVPFIVKWPGKVKPGLVSDEPVLAHDWVATMYEIGNVSMEKDQAMDCTSLLSIMTGQRERGKALHPFILYQGGNPKDGAIREGNFVLIFNRDKKATELYNLKTDLKQEENLIHKPKYKKLVKRLNSTFYKYNDQNSRTKESRTTRAFIINDKK
ncbi:arylsulfatase [Labilibacter sediminis]|nr:arylsulfatase [Labilibacter sediminis]